MAKATSHDQDALTRIFFDTEFTDLIGIAQDPALISIGLITEDGARSFYAELTDAYTIEQCSVFVRVGVLPLLDAPELSLELNYTAIYARMTAIQCRGLLAEWLEQAGCHVELWSDAPQFDWHFIVELFHGQAWPNNLALAPRSCIPGDKALLSARPIRVEEVYSRQHYRRHHALDDAKVNREVWVAESPH